MLKNQKRVKKLAEALVLVCVFVSVLAINATAATGKIESKNGVLYKDGVNTGISVSYGNSWSKTAYFDNDKGILKYGFNTTAVNEDWAKSLHTTKSHQTKVANSARSKTSSSASAGNYTSVVEIRHASGPVWTIFY